MKSGSNKPCNVCHVYHKHCANLIRNLTETFEINCSRICRCTSYDHLRLAFLRNAEYLIIINKTIIINTVRYDIEILT